MIIEKTKIPELLTVSEVSTLMRCSVPKVYYLVADGKLPAIKLGKRGIRFNAEHIKRMLGGAKDEG